VKKQCAQGRPFLGQPRTIVAEFAFLLTQSDRFTLLVFFQSADRCPLWEVCYASKQESIAETQTGGEGNSRHDHKD
jgi:hypothetical protein